MRLTILGNNGPYPMPGGACSGYFVTEGDTRLQLDLGTGTLASLSGRVSPEHLDALVFSHWHHDHTSDVLPLLYRLAEVHMRSGDVLTVIAPKDETSLEYQAVSACPAVKLMTVCPGEKLTVGEIGLEVFTARHPVPAVMYRLQNREGKTLCYTGDTNTVEGFVQFAAKADLLLADGLFAEEEWNEGKPHLSASLAAQLASQAQADRLLITHLHPRCDQKQLLQQARTHFRNVQLARIGDSFLV